MTNEWISLNTHLVQSIERKKKIKVNKQRTDEKNVVAYRNCIATTTTLVINVQVK